VPLTTPSAWRPTRHSWRRTPKNPASITRPDGLQFKILQNGFGKRPYLTDTVKVYYTGMLINGTVFDGTSPGLPASFQLKQRDPGLDRSLAIMREGDHWQLVIPPNSGLWRCRPRQRHYPAQPGADLRFATDLHHARTETG